MIEVEIKLPIRDQNEIIKALSEMKFEQRSHFMEKDRYFDNDLGEIRGNGQALRIRETTDLSSGKTNAQMNFKGKKLDQVSASRKEMEMVIESAQIGEEILNALGYAFVFPEVVKERKVFQCGNVSALVDQVEGLGAFLELEILVDSETEKKEAWEHIVQLINQLGYTQAEMVSTSYLSMLQKKEV